MHFTAVCHKCGKATRVPEQFSQVDAAKIWASNWEDQHIDEEHSNATAEQESSEAET